MKDNPDVRGTEGTGREQVSGGELSELWAELIPSFSPRDTLIVSACRLVQASGLEPFARDGLVWLNSDAGMVSLGLGSWGRLPPDIAVIDGIGLDRLKCWLDQATAKERRFNQIRESIQRHGYSPGNGI